MVSKASEDLPEPDRPVITVSVSRGISTSISLRLCSRAPRTEMWVSIGCLFQICSCYRRTRRASTSAVRKWVRARRRQAATILPVREADGEGDRRSRWRGGFGKRSEGGTARNSYPTPAGEDAGRETSSAPRSTAASYSPGVGAGGRSVQAPCASEPTTLAGTIWTQAPPLLRTLSCSLPSFARPS